MQQYNKVLIKIYLKNICTLKEALRFFFEKSNIKLNKREIVQSADLSEYTEHWANTFPPLSKHIQDSY